MIGPSRRINSLIRSVSETGKQGFTYRYDLLFPISGSYFPSHSGDLPVRLYLAAANRWAYVPQAAAKLVLAYVVQIVEGQHAAEPVAGNAA